MQSLPSVGVIIATYNRPKELSRLLQSLKKQTLPPREIIVVDASANVPGPELNQYTIIRAARGAASQRNLGVKSASSEVLVFVDDDTVLTPECLECIARAFALDHTGKLGAVTGHMLSQTGGNQRRSWIARFFGLGESNGSGRFKYSGFPSLPSGDAEKVTEVLVGGLMAFRRKVLVEIGGFDENLELVSPYSYMEDQDIAFRVRSSGWEIRYLPNALFYHFPSPNGRDDSRTIAATKVLNSRYLLEKNFGLGITRRLAWWAMVGLCLAETKVNGRKGLAGVLLGIKEVYGGGLKRRLAKSGGAGMKPSIQ